MQIIRKGTVVKGIGEKYIEEQIGAVHTRTDGFSIAKMIAPPHWREPFHITEFDEISIVISGTLTVEQDGKIEHIHGGETCWVEKNSKTQYRNDTKQECYYWSLCIPAYKPERVKHP